MRRRSAALSPSFTTIELCSVPPHSRGEQDPVRLTTFQCGNGQLDPAETCDDGNFEAGDGCDPRCNSECGNGNIDQNETCDDGNLSPNDGCTDACELARCGDGIIWLGNEDCRRRRGQ